eukprot:scaffold16853_cov30-Tisochrysis_lutea.AAC.2
MGEPSRRPRRMRRSTCDARCSSTKENELPLRIFPSAACPPAAALWRSDKRRESFRVEPPAQSAHSGAYELFYADHTKKPGEEQVVARSQAMPECRYPKCNKLASTPPADGKASVNIIAQKIMDRDIPTCNKR